MLQSTKIWETRSLILGLLHDCTLLEVNFRGPQRGIVKLSLARNAITMAVIECYEHGFGIG